MTESILRECSKILSGLTKDKPWMTARGLANRIQSTAGIRHLPKNIETALIEHAQLPRRQIRYSHYPSKKTLDILWGHIDVVGEKENLAELERLDEPVQAGAAQVSEDAPWFFISHNHRDFKAALGLQGILLNHGFGAWLFETGIPQGGLIMPVVQQAVQECRFFLSYVTRRSLGSLWVQKEIESIRQTGCRDIFVVLDGHDPELLILFETWTGSRSHEAEQVEAFCRMAAGQAGHSSYSAWDRRCCEFMATLHEFVNHTHCVIAYPSPPPDLDWHGKRLQLVLFEKFMADLNLEGALD